MARSAFLAVLVGMAQAQVIDTSAIVGAATSALGSLSTIIDTSALGDLTSLVGAATSVALPSEASSLAGAASSALAGITTTTRSSGAAAATGSGSYLSVLAGNGYLQGGFAGSIVGGDVCRLTYAVACTQSVCGSGETAVPSGVTITVTQGPSTLLFSTSISTGGVAVSISQGCNVSGSSSATCTAAASASAQGVSSSTTVTTTFSAKYDSLLITAGTIPTGSCTSTGTGAAAPTAFVDLVKVVAVPAAAFAAAALV